MREYYLANKEKWARDTPEKQEHHRKLVKESYGRCKEKRRKRHDKWAEDNHARVLFLQARRSAGYRGLEFNLDPEDVVIPETCPYLGCKLTSTQGQGRVWTNASIDRIDSSKGYIKGNIQIVSVLANSMKQQATIEQLQAFAEGVMRLHPKEVCCEC
jgi:hypothetical protein